MGKKPVYGYDSIEYASLTDVGVRRSHNQDAHASMVSSDSEQWLQRGHIFLVADGMGAHAVGELASELAVSIIPHTYHKYVAQDGVPALRKAFIEANASIHSKGQQNPEFAGMGTTTTALLLRPEGAWVGHVGDSRAYRIRGGKIEQMSFDHSLVWEMAKRQGIDPDSLPGIPSNVIIRSLGPEPLVQVDVEGPHPIEPGDMYLLCSDGLSGQVSDAEIATVATLLPPAEACHFLVDLANLRGGPDNVTVVIVRVHDEPANPAIGKPPGGRRFRLPWPLSFLILGIVLSGYAFVLAAYGYHTGGMAVFVMSALAILAGMGGLFLAFRQEKRRLEAKNNTPLPKMYRECRFVIGSEQVAILQQVNGALEKLVYERGWEVDWEEYQDHRSLAERLVAQNDLGAACRELCRAFRTLTEAALRQRGRSEILPTIWEKA